MLSFLVIFRAITQLRAWQGDALSDASIVALLLGVLLALGGGCLALRGIKHGSRAADGMKYRLPLVVSEGAARLHLLGFPLLLCLHDSVGC